MVLGNLKFNIPVALAPMAGCADRAMRELCMSHGADFCVGELCSAKGITMGDKKSENYLKISESERPMAPQLFGSNPEIMAQAAKIALKYNPNFIDINMGCPAKKVGASGGGAELLKDMLLAEKIVATVKSAVNVPVTAKMRIGIDEKSIVAAEFAKALESGGADMITVHGRTKEQMYGGTVNYREILNVKNGVKVPIIANGDIKCGADAVKMLDKTGADGIMIGRAALGNPFIFESVKAYLKGESEEEISLEKRLDTLVLQCEKMLLYKDEKNAMLEARKHAAWYIKGVKNAAKLRVLCNEINSLGDIKNLCERILTEE